jgi:hypothetical protein
LNGQLYIDIAKDVWELNSETEDELEESPVAPEE